MGLLNKWRENRLNEATKSFKTKLKPSKKSEGEGFTDIKLSSQSLIDSLSSFNLFYDNYINKSHKNEIEKLKNYRNMAAAPEILDVIEDAAIEASQEDQDGEVLHLELVDEQLKNNENKVKTLKDEFYELFYNRLKIQNEMWNIFYNYFVDGKVYQERVGKNKVGITDIKMLPADTMDFKLNQNGKIEFFVQYLTQKTKLPATFEEGEKDDNVIVFYPSQISYVNFGMFGQNRKDVLGFLEKCKQPYNQLKLLETAVVIYRIIRAPERFVFSIDTGNMPREKAMAYVEKMKTKYQKKLSYDPDSGSLGNQPDVLCIRQNTEIKLLDGRCLPLKEVIKEYNEGKENWVYSINQDTYEIEPGKIVNAKITRKNENLVKVYLDDGSYHDVTYDHKFVMRDGSEKRADNLKEHDSLMPLYTKLDSIKVTKIEFLKEKDDTGCITIEENHNFAISYNGKPTVFIKNSVLENFWLPQSADGRGSQVNTVGGDPSGFAEMDDIFYFQKKLFKSLKYPLSRVVKAQENQQGDVLFANGRTEEITRDEISWARFLERQQNRFCFDFKELFLLHLEFKGIKKEYKLNRSSFNIHMTAPNQYKDQINQLLLETRMDNYQNLANNPEFPKSWLQNKYLKMDVEEIEELKKWFDMDDKIYPSDDDMGF